MFPLFRNIGEHRRNYQAKEACNNGAYQIMDYTPFRRLPFSVSSAVLISISFGEEKMCIFSQLRRQSPEATQNDAEATRGYGHNNLSYRLLGYAPDSGLTPKYFLHFSLGVSQILKKIVACRSSVPANFELFREDHSPSLPQRDYTPALRGAY